MMKKFLVILFLLITGGCASNIWGDASQSPSMPGAMASDPLSPATVNKISIKFTPTWKNPVQLKYGEKIDLNLV
jgi:hypothetical protein